MEVTFELPDYDPAIGLQYKWEPGFLINVIVDEEGVTIQGNSAGLTSLADQLISLASSAVPSTSHIHLDAGAELKDGSANLLITTEFEYPR